MAAAMAEERGRQEGLLQLAAERLSEQQLGDSRKAASKYDFVKIKVKLGEQLEHYYILSRFLLSRMLTVIKVPQHKAVRIALDVKKQLVDSERLEISQAELEDVLFAALHARGFGDLHVQRYKMVSRFYQQKRPLIVLVCGSACTGKSTLAQQLASRLNLPNVLQTDVLYELLRTSGLGDLSPLPLWARPLEGEALLAEFARECACIRRALDGDLAKCIRDGKSIIIEGLHLDPGLFLAEFGQQGAAHMLGNGSGGFEGAAAAAVAMGAPASSPPQSAGRAAVLPEVAEGTPHEAAASPPQHAAAQQPSSTSPPAAEGQLRRSASFDDAATSLRYTRMLHRQESPWRGAISAAGAQPAGGRRPASAQSFGGGLERGRVTFMLRASSTSTFSPTIMSPASPQLLGPALAKEDKRGLRQLQAAGVQQLGSQVEQLHLEGATAGRLQAVVPSSSPPLHGKQPAEALEQQQQDGPIQQQEQQLLPAPHILPQPAQGPVFVPLVLSVAEADYEPMVRDWYARQQVGAGKEGVGLEAALQRLRLLQSHLQRSGAAGVPVVQVNVSSFHETLDALHDYVLQCIQLALEQEQQSAAAGSSGG